MHPHSVIHIIVHILCAQAKVDRLLSMSSDSSTLKSVPWRKAFAMPPPFVAMDVNLPPLSAHGSHPLGFTVLCSHHSLRCHLYRFKTDPVQHIIVFVSIIVVTEMIALPGLVRRLCPSSYFHQSHVRLISFHVERVFCMQSHSIHP